MSRRRKAAPGAPEGGLVVDKPAGPTSHDVVAAVRRALGQPRIGHTGTLDPQATGVLPLLLGRATRLAQFLAASDKTYRATVRFGQATTSGDAAGEPLGAAREVTLDPAAVEAALARFRGRFAQRPPEISAKKVGGHRAYDLVRQSRPVALAPVDVEVTELVLLGCAGDTADLRVTASAGFYVRALARDLGDALGAGAHLTALRRERSGRFTLADAAPLDRIVADPKGMANRVIPAAGLLPDLPAAILDAPAVDRVAHGQALGPAHVEGWQGPASGVGQVRLLDEAGRLVALAEPRAGLLHPVLVLV
jgi:tRNA pseudouridine55 synthase